MWAWKRFSLKLMPANIESRNMVIHHTTGTKDSRNCSLKLMFLKIDDLWCQCHHLYGIFLGQFDHPKKWKGKVNKFNLIIIYKSRSQPTIYVCNIFQEESETLFYFPSFNFTIYKSRSHPTIYVAYIIPTNHIMTIHHVTLFGKIIARYFQSPRFVSVILLDFFGDKIWQCHFY